MSLPIFQNGDRDLQLLQTSWAQQLNPVIELPTNKGHILKEITLSIGPNSINHLLGRKLQGWYIVRQRAASSLYDLQDSNQIPSFTLILNSSAAVTVDIFVF
jgi:hypothetical protein